MPRAFTVSFENTSVTNANGTHDLFEITPADDRPVTVIGLFLSQSTELAEAEEEQLRISVIRGHTTSGTGGTATTPRPLDPRSSAAGFTAETVNTTVASAGTTVTLHSETWNVRAGYGLWLPDGLGWKVDQGQTTLVVRLMAAVTDNLSMSGTLYAVEV